MAAAARHYDLVVAAGDGTGAELLRSALQCLDSLQSQGITCTYHPIDIGHAAYQRTGHAITEQALQTFEQYKVMLKGSLTIPTGKQGHYMVHIRGRSFTSANQVFRKLYNLSANIRPAKSFPQTSASNARFDDVDIVTVRENTEGLYSGIEHGVAVDRVETLNVVTREATRAVAQQAVQYAVKHKRRRITALHKANVLPKADGLWLQTIEQVIDEYHTSAEGKQHPVEYKTQLADSALTLMMQKPQEFDVVLCNNMVGDLVSDLTAGMIGSLGLLGAGQVGKQHALFEPAHGSGPDIAGKNIVNPISMLESAAMMLGHLGELDAEQLLRQSIRAVMTSSNSRSLLTPDLGGTGTTSAFTDAICQQMRNANSLSPSPRGPAVVSSGNSAKTKHVTQEHFAELSDDCYIEDDKRVRYYAEAKRSRRLVNRFESHNNVQLTYISRAVVRGVCDIRDYHCQSGADRHIHGGILSTLSYAVASTGSILNNTRPNTHSMVITQYIVDLFRSAYYNQILYAKATPLKLGNTTHCWSVLIHAQNKDGSGKRNLVASSQVTTISAPVPSAFQQKAKL